MVNKDKKLFRFEVTLERMGRRCAGIGDLLLIEGGENND